MSKKGSFFQSTGAAWLLVVLLVAWQVWVAGPDASTDGGTLIRYGARKPSFGFPQAPWRLFGSIFLHGGWLHLVCNGLLIALWGGQVCRLLGAIPFLCCFLLSGFWGSIFSDIYGPEALAVGASGGATGLVFLIGVLSLLAASRPSWKGQHKSWLSSTAFVIILNGLMAAGITSSGYGILDHWAHLGGAIAGTVLGVFALKDKTKNKSFYLGVVFLTLAAAGVCFWRGSSPLG